MDRQAHFTREANSQKMPFRLVQATMDEGFPARGINLSHRLRVMDAKKRGLPECWIGEDDMKFFGPGAFDYFVRHKPDDFDLYLSGTFHGVIRLDHTIGDFSGMTLYVVHSRFYDTFLSVNPNDNIDRALRHKGRYVVCDPIVTTQYGGFSDHQKKDIVNYDRHFRGRNLYKPEIHATL